MSLSTLPHLSLVDGLRLLPPRQRSELFARLATRPGALSDVRHDWQDLDGKPGFWARPEQCFTFEDVERHGLIVICGARREGKTRAARELWVRGVDEGRALRPRVFGATEADVDKSIMHGVSGIMTHLSPDQRRRWRWIADEGPAGTVRVRNKLGRDVEVVCFSAAAPEGAVSHAGDWDLYDDVKKWGSRALTAWTHARISCSEGDACGIVATTRDGTALLRKLLGGKVDGVLVRNLRVGGNRTNLAAKWRGQIKAELGEVAGDLLRQELDDEDTSASSPFGPPINFDAAPIRLTEVRREDLVEIVVAVDESGGKGGDHDLWGIGGAGRFRSKHVVALEDDSGSYDDAEAGEKILRLCERLGATKIIVERNRGDRVLTVIRAAWYKRMAEGKEGELRALPEIVGVVAREQKQLRAGVLRPLYLGGMGACMLHHGPHPSLRLLERQQREWDPDAPPRPRQDDRIDWWVHAVHHLARLGPGKDALPPAEAFEGFDDAQRALPAPGWGASREAREVDATASDGDDGSDGWDRA